MLAYIVRRLLLIIPTLFGIMVLNFAIVQFAPGGPVEQTIARAERHGRLRHRTDCRQLSPTWAASRRPGQRRHQRYRGARGLDPGIIKEIERMYGFDKPAHERFWMMMKDYATFNFGESFFKGRPVVDLVHREDAGIDLARPLDDADHLSGLHPAGHRQSGARRQHSSMSGPASSSS